MRLVMMESVRLILQLSIALVQPAGADRTACAFVDRPCPLHAAHMDH